MNINLSPRNLDDYQRFLTIKRLPHYRFAGRTATFPDEYAATVSGINVIRHAGVPYQPHPAMFDYQRDINAMAADKRKFSLFEDCGLGKTIQLLDFARHAARSLPKSQCVLIVSPLMVVEQTLAECEKWYGGDLKIEHLRGTVGVQEWLTHGTSRIAITNYDAMDPDLRPGRLGGLVLDESSMLKSHYGVWGGTCIRLGKGCTYKLAATGTPAPNDRIEYANHAVFMDAFPTVNSYLARFFVNRGQTSERWELKKHALKPFYTALSHWCIFLTNPATYGWKDNCENVPPIHVHIEEVPLTAQQRDLSQQASGQIIATHMGGIGSRSTMGQLAKGQYQGEAIETHKPAFIRRRVESWKDESTIIWCIYNREQELVSAQFPGAAIISGDTPLEERLTLIDDFKAGRRPVLISKPKILGFGLNLQRATRQVFSGLQDSYESYYQAVKRSNRYGSTKPLNVHIPITDLERPMVENVLNKAARVQLDTEEQERIFRDVNHARLAV